jgi:hypothetical protein
MEEDLKLPGISRNFWLYGVMNDTRFRNRIS